MSFGVWKGILFFFLRPSLCCAAPIATLISGHWIGVAEAVRKQMDARPTKTEGRSCHVFIDVCGMPRPPLAGDCFPGSGPLRCSTPSERFSSLSSEWRWFGASSCPCSGHWSQGSPPSMRCCTQSRCVLFPKGQSGVHSLGAFPTGHSCSLSSMSSSACCPRPSRPGVERRVRQTRIMVSTGSTKKKAATLQTG